MTTSTLDSRTFGETASGSSLVSANDWGKASSQGNLSNFGLERSRSEPRRDKRAIRRQDVAEVTGQLAIMIKSGVDLGSALTSLANQCQRPALKAVLEEVRESVLAGSSFSDALRVHPQVFEPSFIATVAAGEASGKMSSVLKQLAVMQKQEIRRARDVRGLLTYPVLLFVVSSSVLVALLLFVLPRFATLFEQYEATLPAITEFLLGIAAELRYRWWLWGTLLLAAGVGALAWRKTSSGRRSIDRFWIKAPIIGEICCGMCVGAMCRLLGLMLDSGVTLLESLRLTQQAVGNSLYKDLLANLEDAVMNGQGLAQVLQESDVVPESAKEMIVTAENTGNLNEVTGILGEYYDEESEAKLRQLVGMLEPLITVAMGVVVAIVVLAVMLPVFNLSTLSSGGH